MTSMIYKQFFDAQVGDWVFENAIEQGKLSQDRDSDNCVYNYMYMHSTNEGSKIIDHFKNRTTREYDVVAIREKR